MGMQHGGPHSLMAVINVLVGELLHQITTKKEKGSYSITAANRNLTHKVCSLWFNLAIWDQKCWSLFFSSNPFENCTKNGFEKKINWNQKYN